MRLRDKMLLTQFILKFRQRFTRLYLQLGTLMNFKNLTALISLGLSLYLCMSVDVAAENLKTTPNLDASYHLTKDPSNQKVFKDQMSGEDPNVWLKRGQLEKNEPNYKVIWEALKDSTRSSIPADRFHVGLNALTEAKDEYLGWIYWERYSAPNASEVEAKLALGIFNLNPLGRTLSINANIKPMTSFVLGDSEYFLDFDLGKYYLGPLGRAIGVRTYRVACGAGGSICSNELLRLFTTQEPEMREVFISRVGFYGNYGGEWNKDGTRQHFIEELNAIVILHPSAKNIPPQITVKAKLRKRTLKREFKWTKGADGRNHYETTDREIFPQVHKFESLDSPYWRK